MIKGHVIKESLDDFNNFGEIVITKNPSTEDEQEIFVIVLEAEKVDRITKPLRALTKIADDYNSFKLSMVSGWAQEALGILEGMEVGDEME